MKKLTLIALMLLSGSVSASQWICPTSSTDGSGNEYRTLETLTDGSVKIDGKAYKQKDSISGEFYYGEPDDEGREMQVDYLYNVEFRDGIPYSILQAGYFGNGTQTFPCVKPGTKESSSLEINNKPYSPVVENIVEKWEQKLNPSSWDGETDTDSENTLKKAFDKPVRTLDEVLNQGEIGNSK
ncbi:hypothetical protein ACOIFF_03395 [Klebsiella pneumoniae]|uniref:hypothetical protein n=1 Tax=Klebsiella pneumoniae TaxID=573 RepID=UPI000807EAC8|nr:hypothetical protein [Klebsiella pneumoniae]MBZ1999399.1 hypothetical protein [Klebsiella pneumoniae]MCQ0735028.1 hypothetical protein [Klebsiella pneumoniae]MDD1879022.1 hypothetical protein [Klebsiella pneumoniae]MEB5562830.1 hypothetical protein [Klebsiella pneumoniae]MEC4502307.1 hypothetical protein [Klebsiella pneumoniae]